MAAAQPYITGVSGDFPEGQIVPRQLVGINLILIRCRGVLQCYLDECAHQPVKLSEFGEVRGGLLVCHAHGGCFDLDCNGRVASPPPQEDLKAFKVLEENGQVSVFI